MPTARSRSPVSAQMAAVTVRAATRAISPRRRHEHELRGRELPYLQTLPRLLGVPEIVLHLQA